MKLPTIDAGAVKAVSYAVIALAGLYYVSRLGAAHQAGSDALKPVANALSNAWSKLTQGPGVQGSYAYVVLKPRDFINGYLSNQSRDALTSMHPANGSLLARVINPAGMLKDEYQPLLLAGGLAVDENGVYAL